MTLEDFFREKAHLYSIGDVAGSAQDVDIPITARIAGSTFAGNRIEDVIFALEVYRTNLLVESYERTEIVEFHAAEPVDGRVQVFARYRNVNDAGAEISAFDASFICREASDGGWLICEAETIPPVKTRFLNGIPLA